MCREEEVPLSSSCSYHIESKKKKKNRKKSMIVNDRCRTAQLKKIASLLDYSDLYIHYHKAEFTLLSHCAPAQSTLSFTFLLD